MLLTLLRLLVLMLLFDCLFCEVRGGGGGTGIGSYSFSDWDVMGIEVLELIVTDGAGGVLAGEILDVSLVGLLTERLGESEWKLSW